MLVFQKDVSEEVREASCEALQELESREMFFKVPVKVKLGSRRMRTTHAGARWKTSKKFSRSCLNSRVLKGTFPLRRMTFIVVISPFYLEGLGSRHNGRDGDLVDLMKHELTHVWLFQQGRLEHKERDLEVYSHRLGFKMKADKSAAKPRYTIRCPICREEYYRQRACKLTKDAGSYCCGNCHHLGLEVIKR